jgi:hypothetical protein
MSQRTSGGVYNMGRRSATLETEKVPFTEADIKRINKEISILKTKL